MSEKPVKGRKYVALWMITLQTSLYYVACAFEPTLASLMPIQVSIVGLFGIFMGANAASKKFTADSKK